MTTQGEKVNLADLATIREWKKM